MNFDSRLFLSTMPIITSMVALLIILFDISNGNQYNRRLKVSIVFYLGFYTITMSGVLVYFYFPLVFMCLNALIMVSFIVLPILLYAFIFQITRTRPDEKFSKWHFLIPAVIGLFQLFLTLVTPTQDQLLTITGNGDYHGGSKLFFYFSNGIMLDRLLFSMVYTTLSFMRFPKYSRFIRNYASNESKSSLRWLKIYLIFIVCLIPIPLAGVFMSRSGLMDSWIPWIHYSMLLVQHSYLAYHLVRQDYITLFQADEEDLDMFEVYGMAVGKTNYNSLITCPNSANFIDFKNDDNQRMVLVKEEFENYMQQAQPFLNSELKITDLAKALNTNRTYISAFINAEYSKNFSCLINLYRVDEYYKRRNSVNYKHLNDQELTETVGFKSHRNFLRIISQLDDCDS